MLVALHIVRLYFCRFPLLLAFCSFAGLQISRSAALLCCFSLLKGRFAFYGFRFLPFGGFSAIAFCALLHGPPAPDPPSQVFFTNLANLAKFAATNLVPSKELKGGATIPRAALPALCLQVWGAAFHPSPVQLTVELLKLCKACHA